MAKKRAKLDKSTKKTLIITVGVLLGLIIILNFMRYSSFSPTVSSEGTATIKVLPDLISIYFIVDSKGVNASQATERNAEIVNKMKSSLAIIGIPENAIKTLGFSVFLDYDPRTGNPLNTYRATHSLKVEIPILEKNKVGNVIDSSVRAGAGISYINYELNEENQKRYKIEAIKRATEDAKIKAEALVEGSGNRLGPLVSVSLNEFNYIPWLAVSKEIVRDSTGTEIETQINPNEQEISAVVIAVFRIK